MRHFDLTANMVSSIVRFPVTEAEAAYVRAVVGNKKVISEQEDAMADPEYLTELVLEFREED